MGPPLLAGETLGTDRTPKDIGYTPVWLVPENCFLVFPGRGVGGPALLGAVTGTHAAARPDPGGAENATGG